MDELEQTLIYLKEVLETVPGVNYVSNGKPVPLLIDNNVASIYIVPTNEAFINTKNKVSLCGYDNYVYIKLIVNMECQTDLEWVSFRNIMITLITLRRLLKLDLSSDLEPKHKDMVRESVNSPLRVIKILIRKNYGGIK